MEYSELPIEPILRSRLCDYVYDIVGCMHIVHSDLGNGLPEYIYQEALYLELSGHGYSVKKEYRHHPSYRGTQLESFIRMDLMVEMPKGNVIIECKALPKITAKEKYQTFGYLRGTRFPIAILVNFGTYPKAEIQKYYYKDGVIRAF